MYVTRRRNRVLRKVNQKPLDPARTNPSKRHRERLNGELEHLASLLPFEQSVIDKLDKLSVLRLAVSYLRAKSYYRVISPSCHSVYSALQCDADSQLKALNGFLMVVDPNSEVFYVSETVEQYLGFHQSDILHQSLLELVHSEDRESVRQQLNWSNVLMHVGPNPSSADISRLQGAGVGIHQLLHRSFIVRFRCLLDNTSGFITMEICGHLQPLYGQVGMGGLAMFAVCTPFGPIPVGDFNAEDITFRTKHKLDMSIINVEPRGKMLLGELENTKIYSLLHPSDVQYFANSHKEMLKTGSSGLVAYRLMDKDGKWLWIQTTARVIYRNTKPDYLMCFHRNLTEEEGANIVGKRNIEFAMPNLHAESLMDDEDYVEDIPRTSKVRKPRKSVPPSTQTVTTEPVPYDTTQSLQNKDHSSLYYPFQGFPTPVHQYSPSSSQLNDSYGFSMDHMRLPYPQSHMDYLTYPPNPLHSTVMSMDADRLTAVAMIHPPHTTYPYAESQTRHNVLYNTDPSENSQYSVPRHYLQNYSMPSSIFRTDINSNSLLSFRDMTYPALNQSYKM